MPGRYLRGRLRAAAPLFAIGVGVIAWSGWTLLDPHHFGTDLPHKDLPPEFLLLIGVGVVGLALVELLFGGVRPRK